MQRNIFAPSYTFSISHEAMLINEQEDPRPFILCCEASDFHDLQNRSSLFEEINEGTYRLVLASTANEPEINACREAISQDIKSANTILRLFNHYQQDLPKQSSSPMPK